MLTGLRVLVVEDERMVAMLLQDLLEDLGCRVVGVAARLPEAMEKAATLAADVALLDVNLTGALSYPVADILLRRRIPFVFATGYGTAGVPAHLCGAPVLAKPFAQDQLAAALQLATR